MEKKREEDARRFEQMDPVFRTEGELEEVSCSYHCLDGSALTGMKRAFCYCSPPFRAITECYFGSGSLRVQVRRFKAAAYKSLENPRRDVTYDRELARHWMWDETDLHVYIACHVPTGYSDKHLDASMVQGAPPSGPYAQQRLCISHHWNGPVPPPPLTPAPPAWRRVSRP